MKEKKKRTHAQFWKRKQVKKDVKSIKFKTNAKQKSTTANNLFKTQKQHI